MAKFKLDELMCPRFRPQWTGVVRIPQTVAIAVTIRPIRCSIPVNVILQRIPIEESIVIDVRVDVIRNLITILFVSNW